MKRMFKEQSPDSLKDWGGGLFFDMSHYIAVCRAREERGLPVFKNENAEYNHPLVGKKLRCKSNGEIYNVERCKRHWHLGWYYSLLLERDGTGSHVCVTWDLCEDQKKYPGTCCELTLRHIREHQEDFELI